MKVAFIGGGSLRLLPILRGILADSPQIFAHGELRFIDLKQERAEAVAALVKACPEFQKVNQCTVSCPSSLDEGLKGIDVLYLTMAARREPTETLASFAAQTYNYYSSDQLSVNGAFLSLRLGGLIMNIAKKMEKLCPKALMLIFANPVAVYSCMVNTYTKIRALGICGGFNNHRWDLSRMFHYKNEFDPKWNVVAAGVNHLSYIIRGEYDGEDLYSSLCPRILNNSWKCLPGHELALNILNDVYRRYGSLIFSTELDGAAHIACQVALDFQRKTLEKHVAFEPEAARLKSQTAEEQRFQDFIKQSKTPATVNWNSSSQENLYYGKNITDISIPIFKALSGIEKMRIIATRPNMDAVDGFPENAVLEYTMDVYKDEITPVENQYVPEPFHGLTASLSEFQTLQAQAIAQHDPKIFADALDAYPVNRFMPSRKEFFLKMFDIYTDIDEEMQKARHFFE